MCNLCHMPYFWHFPSSLRKRVSTYFLCHLAELFITGSIACLPYHPGILSSSLLFAEFPYLLSASNDTMLSQFAYESDTKICLLAFGKNGSSVKLFEAPAYKTPDCHPDVLCPSHRSGPFIHQHHFPCPKLCSFLTRPKLCSWTNDKSNQWNNHRSISHLSSASLYHLLSSSGSINLAAVGHYHL